MPCYRDGGCGPCESYSCSECPASKPEYLTRRRASTRRMSPDVLARRVLTKQSRVEAGASDGNRSRDADDVLRELIRDERAQKPGVASRVIDAYLNSADRASAERLFLELTGASWTQYLKLSEAALDEVENLAPGTNPPKTVAPRGVNPSQLAKMPESAKLLVEQLPDWPHWRYKYFELNEATPRVGKTSEGLASVPSYAIKIWPAHGADDEERDDEAGDET